MVPNFLCIGAQKCGTTSIWRLLDGHPDVFMAAVRETRFFCDDFQFYGGIQRYEVDYFSAWDGQSAVGEKCPEYLYVPGVAERILESLGPETRFIVALRDPAQRAFSHFRHNLATLRERRSFSAVIDEEAKGLVQGRWPPVPLGYLSRGLYARQLEPYLALFPLRNFCFVNFEREVMGDQQTLADRIYAFLGAKAHQVAGLPFMDGRPALAPMTVRSRRVEGSPTTSVVEIAERSFHRPRTRAGLGWWRPKRIVGQVEKTRIANPSGALIDFSEAFTRHKPASTSVPPDEARELNRRHFADDIARLVDLIPFSPDGWLD